MEAQGLDASALKELLEWMNEMKEKAKEMLKDEYKKIEFFNELDSKFPEFEKKINDSMKQQIKEKFLPKAENNLIKLRNAIELAREEGLDASELQSLTTEIEVMVSELKEKIEKAKGKRDFEEIAGIGKQIREKMGEARELYEELRGK
jgi:glutamine synthetase type III